MLPNFLPTQFCKPRKEVTNRTRQMLAIVSQPDRVTRLKNNQKYREFAGNFGTDRILINVLSWPEAVDNSARVASFAAVISSGMSRLACIVHIDVTSTDVSKWAIPRPTFHFPHVGRLHRCNDLLKTVELINSTRSECGSRV
jgi:hypothetical protein